MELERKYGRKDATEQNFAVGSYTQERIKLNIRIDDYGNVKDVRS